MIRETAASSKNSDANARDDSGAVASESAAHGEVSVAVPAFNEEQSIVRLLEALVASTVLAARQLHRDVLRAGNQVEAGPNLRREISLAGNLHDHGLLQRMPM